MNKLLGTVVRLFQTLWDKRPFVLRAIFCLFVGLLLLLNERRDDFDLRFKLRGNTLDKSEIVLILISEDEWFKLRGQGFQTLRPLKELESLNDSFFGDKVLWEKLLHQILKQNPKSIGVSFYLGDSWSKQRTPLSSVLTHPKVHWGARLDSDGQILRPRSFIVDESHLGLIDLKTDSDGIIRRIGTTPSSMYTLPQVLAQKRFELSPTSKESLLINFQGPESSFLAFTLTELLFGNIPTDALKNKIVIIGARGTQSHTLLTPLGPMTKAEVLANITHDYINSSWIKVLPYGFYAAYLLILLALTLYIVVNYSQTAVLVFLGSLWGLSTALSMWIFDSLCIWIPIVAPTGMIVVSFVVFLSYQLILNERANWRLQKEKRYMEEVEEVKNNFLSLISHDLKTPIAKIQAVTDKLLNQSAQDSSLSDLKIIKNANLELHRYIQSLLQVIRIESTDFKARKTPSDLNELIKKTVETLSPFIKEKSIQIEQDLEPLFSMELDTTLIQEVLLNFLENAVKYSPPNSTISICSQENENNVEVTIKDQGPGIPEDELPKVWNKFYRGRKHDMTTKGSGLGLYLAKYFIELHGGNVFLTSRLSEGTTVGFRLPLDEAIS